MAYISFRKQSEFYKKLQQLQNAAETGDLVERAVAAGAAPVADAIRDSLEGLPTEKFRKLPEGEKFAAPAESVKSALLDGFGLAPIQRKDGFVTTKAGFDGYGKYPTKSYPYGVPNALIARAIESGSSVREKTPFVRSAVNATRKEAIKAMDKVIDDDLKKIFKEE